MRLGVQVQQLRIVIEHLFEMWDAPVLVDRVPMETASQLIVNAALGHTLERKKNRILQRGVSAAPEGAKHHSQIHRIGELGSASKSAVLLIDVPQQRLTGTNEICGSQLGRPSLEAIDGQNRQTLRKLRGVALDVFGLRLPSLGERSEQP